MDYLNDKLLFVTTQRTVKLNSRLIVFHSFQGKSVKKMFEIMYNCYSAANALIKRLQ